MAPDRTPIAIVRDHVEDWRRANAWSRETLAQQIVETHEQLGFDRLTGIRFDPPTRDAFERMRVNADKVYRWLDDSSKDRNLLTANFLWSILAALPLDRRLALAEALLAPVGLAVAVENSDEGPEVEVTHAVVMQIQSLATAASEVTVSMTQLVDGVHAGEAEAAKKKLSRMALALQPAIRLMNRLLRRRHKTGAGQ